MDDFVYWRLADELTVIQAAVLITGKDPAHPDNQFIERSSAQDRPQGFDAAFAALKHAIMGDRLKATLRYGESHGYHDHDPEPDWNLTTVMVDNVRAWLSARRKDGVLLSGRDRRSRLS